MASRIKATAVASAALALTLAGAAAADEPYPPSKPDTGPHVEVRDKLYDNDVSRVRLGATYKVIADLGVDTWEDEHFVYVCVKVHPAGGFKCERDRTYNFNDGVWPYGTPLTVKAKNVWNGRVFIRIVDTNKRLIMKRTLLVR